MAPPDAAIIIPHYNDPERLARCLTALTRNDLSRVEVLVVDNNSPTPPTEVQTRFPDVRFVVEREKGAAAARNRGVAETDAPLLFFIDADCVAADDWVAKAHEVAPTADLIGGRVDVFDETPPPRSGAEAFEAVFAFNFQNYIEVQGFTGSGNLVTTREVFEDVGGFRGGVSEDLDWSTRAVSNGHKLIYREDLVVSHPSRSDWAALRHKWRRLTQELYGVNGNTPRDRMKWAVRALAMPISAIVHTPKVLSSDKLDGWVERLRAVGTLFRLRFQRMVWMLRQAMGQDI
ncbi:glycosyltransferase family 2 protein [Aliiroseovarius sp. Z3]|uniref:glycosyltransferase family 2 protein n=1 Tax=Aliiroseovarius sp. Z3 TaxID=2811402 RepID=UPI0023B2FF93|nr:glycosyltransferase [Aliiroseovarius sp. Z3]MDE9451642.1 glycosyltransferase family 2 protein [Aliiroseovarius sp. Z3]